MRLKSKIIVICSIVVLLAASLCSISVYVIMDKNFHEEAAIQTLQAATEFYTSLDEKLAKYERRKEGPTDNIMNLKRGLRNWRDTASLHSTVGRMKRSSP